MSMKLPTQEELQAAQNEHSQAQENFCPISLGDWLNLCRMAEVPHVPAAQVTQVSRKTTSTSTLKAITAPG